MKPEKKYLRFNKHIVKNQIVSRAIISLKVEF
jgi:hypothetical protein